MGKPNYFEVADFAPFVGHDIEYLAYVYPRGTGNHDDDRYLTEVEESTLERIEGNILVLKIQGSHLIGDTDERQAYTDIYLVPVEVVVEVRINIHREE